MKAWIFTITPLRLTFSDIGPIQIYFRRREPRMSEIRQHGNEAKNKNILLNDIAWENLLQKLSNVTTKSFSMHSYSSYAIEWLPSLTFIIITHT